MVTGTFRLPPVQQFDSVNTTAEQDYKSGLYYLRRNSTVDKALPLLERAVSSDPDSALTHAALAEGLWWKYSLSGDTAWRDRAAEALRQAELRNPDLSPVHALAGLLLSDGGRHEQAVARYSRATELDPKNGDAYRRLGAVYDELEEYNKALAAYHRAAEVDSQYYRNHQALGHFFIKRANYEQAIQHFRRAVELVPDEPVARMALAVAYGTSGNFTNAETELRTALSLRETPAALYALGSVLMYLGRDQEAVPYFTRALTQFPENFLPWMNLGTAYRRLNLVTEAERANRRALALAESEMQKNPRNSYAHACVAYICAWLGEQARARSEIAQALQLSPQDNDTRRMAVKTYEALRQREDSLSVLSGSPLEVRADLSRYPDLADLHRDPRFQVLMSSSSK
jgi:Flp pilus assembly protein TadD